MKRSFVVISLLSLVVINGIAHADSVPTCTAMVVSPTKDGSSGSGSMPVNIGTEHKFTVTGGTSNASFTVKWDCGLGHDGTFDTNRSDNTLFGSLQHYDANGNWKLFVKNTSDPNAPSEDTVKLWETDSLSVGYHTFQAKSSIHIINGGENSANDSKRMFVGPYIEMGSPLGPPVVVD